MRNWSAIRNEKLWLDPKGRVFFKGGKENKRKIASSAKKFVHVQVNFKVNLQYETKKSGTKLKKFSMKGDYEFQR